MTPFSGDSFFFFRDAYVYGVSTPPYACPPLDYSPGNRVPLTSRRSFLPLVDLIQRKLPYHDVPAPRFTLSLLNFLSQQAFVSVLSFFHYR